MTELYQNNSLSLATFITNLWHTLLMAHSLLQIWVWTICIKLCATDMNDASDCAACCGEFDHFHLVNDNRRKKYYKLKLN